jgi:predicted unusual protein kinase regulating ubiquinone biosynthesis (AarF/ABC1/UbiB family)
MNTINVKLKNQLSQYVDSSKKLGKILKFSTQLHYLINIKKASPEEIGVFTRDNLAYLGSTFIKIGQLLSTRSDIFDKRFTQQLTTLQDSAPPFDISMYREDIYKITKEFEEKPIASASIGQVHKGVLNTGETVAIKLKRPDIERDIKTDFQMLLGLLALLRQFGDRRELYELQTIFKQYESLLNEEIDFEREVQNLKQFKTIFSSNGDVKWIRVPEAFQDVSSNDIIVMEYLPAIKINDFDTLDKLQFDRSLIAEKLVECYIKQIVLYGKVHIDPHPGNVGITRAGKIVFYDYGMVCDINSILMNKFEELLIAVSEKDTDLIAKIMVEAEIVFIEPENMIYLKSFVLSFLNYIERVDVSYFKDNFIDKINNKDLPFVINSNFLLILRGVTILEGVCKALDPNFNYKKVIDPYINDNFPIDISYFEKRALKDIESIQRLNINQVISDNKKNDIDKELLEKRLKDINTVREKEKSKQFLTNIVMISVLFTLGLGERVADNKFVQIGLLGLTFLSLYNK